MNGWSPTNYILNVDTGVTVPISQTDYPITRPFSITAGGSRYMTVLIYASAATATATAKLQSGIQGGASDAFWEDARSVVISTTPGWNVIRLNNEASTAQIPLMAAGRVVVSTNGTGTATITKVVVLQEL
jgi:hypothetical protein